MKDSLSELEGGAAGGRLGATLHTMVPRCFGALAELKVTNSGVLVGLRCSGVARSRLLCAASLRMLSSMGGTA